MEIYNENIIDLLAD